MYESSSNVIITRKITLDKQSTQRQTKMMG